MIRINKEQIVKELSLRSFGSMGWMSGKAFCPECGKNDKFGILFTGDSGVVHCFHKDNYKTSLISFLKVIGRDDLLNKDNYSIDNKSVLEPLKTIKNEEISECGMPIGFKRIDKDTYMDERGFTQLQYEKFQVGVSNIEPKVDNKLIFLIEQNFKVVGWIARSKYSKEWHDNNRERAKLGLEPFVLRYENSSGTKFNTILGGLDDITERTERVIIVEGLFDKTNIDNIMGLDFQEHTKCCFTFGADCSPEQVNRLLEKKSVKEIIVLYDKGAESSTIKAGSLLIPFFKVKIGIINDEEVDPGNMTNEYLSDIFLNLKDYLYIYNSIK